MNAAGAPSSGLRAAPAALLTVICLAVAVLVVIFATERPMAAGPSRNRIGDRAALAIRDVVPAFQQWGTRAFTLPNLAAAYGAVEYITMTADATGHADDFVLRFERLARSHESVDLFLLAHTNTFVDWVARVPIELRRKLRLVYNTGCFDAAQDRKWLELGARTYVGHVGLSESPVFYVYFLRRWIRGGAIREVVAESNELTAGVLVADLQSFQFNRRATAASTHATVTGDDSLAIDGVLR